MRHRINITASVIVCLLLSAATAQAQLGSSCLRPLGIPDKWIENQTPPWDPTDTFDPTGPNPDVYAFGYDPSADHGLPMSLVIYNRLAPPQGQSAWAIVVSEPGSVAFQDAITACSGYLHGIGESFPSATGNLNGPFGAAMADLIAQDPDAAWDPSANGGRGGVINSAFPQSPRIIALPAFAPDSYAPSSGMSPAMVKFVGFFVSQRTTNAVNGYITAWSELDAPSVTARMGEWAQLSATFSGPGSPVAGLPIEFLFNDQVVATAQTDGTGTARPSTTSLKVDSLPGDYPGAIRVRLQQPGAGFFLADEAAADLTVLRKLAMISWPSPTEIVYGTPLGAQQLNATADAAGSFSYAPANGTVLSADKWNPTLLSVTFTPDDVDVYDETTATTLLSVRPAPLVLTINDAQKFFLDPLPALTFTTTGLVNGDTASAMFGRMTLETVATAASDVGTYPITAGGTVDAENYDVTINQGLLRIVPRPTDTRLQLAAGTPTATTYGQAITLSINISSGIGVPGGTVTLLSGSTPITTAALINGDAAVTVVLNAGSHALSAAYIGSGGFAASTSATVVRSVTRASTATELTSSLNPSRANDAVTFTATVNPVAPGMGDPTGAVEFLRGGIVVATVPLAGRSAQLTVSTLTAGKHAMQARYVGSANYIASSSAVLQQSVKGGGK